MAAKGLRKLADVADPKVLQALRNRLLMVQVHTIVHEHGILSDCRPAFYRVYVNVRDARCARAIYQMVRSVTGGPCASSGS